MLRAIRRWGSAAAAVALCLSLTACFSTVGKWTYPSGRYPTTESRRPATVSVAVERFLDLRSQTNRSWIIWGYIPFFPVGWMHFDRPEATQPDELTSRYDADPCEDLARSVAVELRRERIVTDAQFVPDEHAKAQHAFLLRGKVRAFYVHESRWTYGVSVYSPILWALALPMGRSANGFYVSLEIVDPKDGRVVWKGDVHDADDVIEGYYYGPEWYRFSWMWERRLREKLGEMAAALGAEAPPLPPNLAKELRETPPPVMPECMGVDAAVPCSTGR